MAVKASASITLTRVNDGAAGVGIKSVDVEYYLSTSSTSQTGGSWSTTAPTWVNGKYIWSRTKTTATDGKVYTSSPACITGAKGSNGTNGSNGATGATGQGVDSITEEYYLSNSKTAQTGGSWVTTPPTWSTGKYMWTRSKIVYKNPTSTEYTKALCDSSWEAVNEIEVGGRNLIIGSGSGGVDYSAGNGTIKSDGIFGKSAVHTTASWTGFYIKMKQIATRNNIKIGDTVTISIYVSTSSSTTITSPTLSLFRQDGSNSSHSFGTRSLVSGQWIRLSHTFKITSSELINTARFESSAATTYEILWSCPQLELGNKATDWTPAPEDVDDSIKDVDDKVETNKKHLADIDLGLDSITQRVSSTEETVKTVNGTVTSNTKRISSVETKITDSAFTMQVQKNNSRVFKVRYIRDWLNGNSINTGNHWVEIQALNNKGENIAYKKNITGSSAASTDKPYSVVVDGNINSTYGSSSSNGSQYVKIDLGAVYETIDCIKVWHYYQDFRIYNGTKLEVSADGSNWITLFDSSVSGTYKESPDGHIVKVNDNNVYTSLGTFNDSGMTISHTNANTQTKMSADGFYILNSNGETVGSLASETGLTILNASEVYASNIQTVYKGPGELFVDHSKDGVGNGTSSNPFTSFSQLSDYLMDNPIIDKDITIQVISTGNVTDHLTVKGLRGRGAITLNLSKTLILNYDKVIEYAIYFYDCDVILHINGGRTAYNSKDGCLLNGWGIGVYVQKCNFANIHDMAINSAINNKVGVLASGTNAIVNRIDFCKCYHGVFAARSSVVGDGGANCGTCSISYYSETGALIQIGGDDNGWKIQGSYRRMSGNILDYGNARTQTASLRTPPAIPPTSDQWKSFSFTDYGYYSEGYGNWNSIGYKTVYQGDWGYGNNRGVFKFDDAAIRSWLSGTVKSGSTITLKRSNAGGYSSAQPIYLCGTISTTVGSGVPAVTKTYGSIGTLAWGEQKTFTLPTAFVNDLKAGTIKNVMFYISNGSSYVKFEPMCTLNLKVNR